MIEQRINEELKRFRSFNKYSDMLMSEQAAPITPEDTSALPPDLGTVPPAPDAASTLPPDMGALPDDGTTPAPDATTDATDTTTDTEADVSPEADDTTEEIDITDLVDMTKSIKKQLDAAGDNQGSMQKMDDIFNKLGELEAKLGEMDSVLSKIDQLGTEIQDIKSKTPEEKLEMRSLDSYPFNEKPKDFFADKQQEMKASGKNEYVLTKDDVENYGKDQIMKSFNPTEQQNDFKY